MTTSAPPRPRRGDVWIARYDPAEGAEMRKKRPVVVISSDGMGHLPVKLVAPYTTADLAPALWRVPVAADAQNGLDRDTTVDLLQTRSLGEHRFIKRLGKVTEEAMEQVAAAMAALVEYT